MIALDTFALLKRIAGASETFADVEADLEKAAIASVKKLLKPKDLTLDRLRALNRAIGVDSLGFILGHDSVKDKDITALVKKLDQHWPTLKSARIHDQRDRLLELATGVAHPTEKVAPPPPAPRNGTRRAPTNQAAPRPSARRAASKSTAPEFSQAMSASPPKDR
jgi:hypothetical protein